MAIQHTLERGTDHTERDPMGRPKGEDTKSVSFLLPGDLIQKLRRARMIDSSYSMTRVIHLAIEEWMDALEAVEDEFETGNGYRLTKPAGMPYPARKTDAMRMGPPTLSERSSARQEGSSYTSARIKLSVFERLEDAVYWRGTLRSHEIEHALRAWFEAHASNEAPM